MNESKLRELYKIAQSLSVLENFDGPFFAFKIACCDKNVYKPQISLYLPYLGEVVQQKFAFNKGWRQLDTLFYHSVQGKLVPTFRSQSSNNNIVVLEAFTPAGKVSKDFYKRVVDTFELYKIRERLSTFDSESLEDEFSLSSYYTFTEYNMSEFSPDKKFHFTHKEGDLYSGSAYLLDGFNEPEHLGSFYHVSKEEIDKNIKCLFL